MCRAWEDWIFAANICTPAFVAPYDSHIYCPQTYKHAMELMLVRNTTIRFICLPGGLAVACMFSLRSELQLLKKEFAGQVQASFCW